LPGGIGTVSIYNANGDHVGYFHDDLAVDCYGHVVGEMYNAKFIGYRTNKLYPTYGSRGAYAGIAVAPYANYVGYSVAGWEDPQF
jgi:hypothetical protein